LTCRSSLSLSNFGDYSDNSNNTVDVLGGDYTGGGVGRDPRGKTQNPNWVGVKLNFKTKLIN